MARVEALFAAANPRPALRAAKRWHFHAGPEHVPPFGLVGGLVLVLAGIQGARLLLA